MKYAIDPHNSWLALEEAAAGEQDDQSRQLILTVRDHMEAEIKAQLEPLMETLTAEPIYHFWGNRAPMQLQGREAVAAFYSGMFAVGSQQFEVVLEKVLATSDHVITEGRVKQVYKGAALAAMGISEVEGSPIADDSLWLTDAQLLTLWPSDADGKLIGEDIYFGVDPMSTLVPISTDQLPPYYQL